MTIARVALAVVLVLAVAVLVATTGLDRAFAHKEKHTPDLKSTRLNSSHMVQSRMPSSA